MTETKQKKTKPSGVVVKFIRPYRDCYKVGDEKSVSPDFGKVLYDMKIVEIVRGKAIINGVKDKMVGKPPMAKAF